MLAYIEALGRDHERFSVVAKYANSCPLGSGQLPIHHPDREYTAKMLGFVDENEPVFDSEWNGCGS